MKNKKRMMENYTIEHSIFIGDKEVLLCVDKTKKLYPFIVCYCTYDNPLSAPWPTDTVGTDNYLEAMGVFTEYVQSQIDLTKAKQEKLKFDMTPFTMEHCIPDDKSKSIVGKVIVLNAERHRYEYQHSAYQLILVVGGNGASGRGRGQAVFGTELSSGESARYERNDVLGEIKPEYMPEWAKESLSKIVQQDKKKSHRREER